MVQIKTSIPGPVLSARSVYNFVEGENKIPRRDIQPSIIETLKIKRANTKSIERKIKIKKDLKRLNRKDKLSLFKSKNNQGETVLKMKVAKKTEKQKQIKKINCESKGEIEVCAAPDKNSKKIKGNNKDKKIDTRNNLIPSVNIIKFCKASETAESSNKGEIEVCAAPDKNSKKIKGNDKNKKIDTENDLIPSVSIIKFCKASETAESNNIEDCNSFDISDSHSNNIDASAILDSIELKKMKYVKPGTGKKKSKVKINKIKNCETNKKTKIKGKKPEAKSMPLIEHGQNVNVTTEELKTSGKRIYNDCSSTTEEPNQELKRKKEKKKEKPSDKKSVILQAELTTLSKELRESKGKKIMKRKIESSAEEGKKKKKITKELQSALELVSFKNEILNKFLRSDLYEVEDSENLGAIVFGSIISPLTPKEFLHNYWEKSHLLIRAADKNRFQSILSTKNIDDILRENNLSFTKNIDITSYTEGKRETHNPEGRALASVVWDYYNSGCSVRLLNPQTFSTSVWKLLSTLQEFFNSFCGANVYLTPPGTQGFAPHWDDIEAFILQLEGKKRWKVYKWRSSKETLPRQSSGNFGLEDRLGELLLDCVLEPGDLLYFPRGYIHQAEALDDAHSLHITLSTYQKNSWVDLLEKLLPAALETAAAKNVEFRHGLPIEYMYNSGIAFADQNSKLKDHLKKKVAELVNKMIEDAPIDAAIDQMAKGFVHDSLPPYVTGTEKKRTVFEGGERWCGNTEGVVNRKELTPETPIRLLRKGCARLLVEEDSVRLFHSVENSREYHEDDPKFIEISAELAPGVEKLIRSYPEYVTVEDLPISTLEDKMILATGLWEKGIIIAENELDPSDLEELEEK